MIALLAYSTSLYGSESVNVVNPSTGGLVNRNDSVRIAYDDLRIVNSKLIQLDYEIKTNNKLRTIVANDSIIINDYKTINYNLNEDCKKAIKQRNIGIGCGVLGVIIGILFIFIK